MSAKQMMKSMVLAVALLGAMQGVAAPANLSREEAFCSKLYPDYRIGGVILRDHDRLYVVGGGNVCGAQQITRVDLDASGWPVKATLCAQIARGQVGSVAAAISGRWLYVTGGGLKGITVRFDILPDGSLTNRTELPNGDRPECEMSGLVASGSYLVLAGGWMTRAVYAAKVQEDGSLGPWVRQRPIPSNCFTQGRIFRLGKRIFATGNPGYKKECDRVYSSEVAADGAVTKWRRWAELPESAVDFDFQPLPDGRGFYFRSGETGAQYVAPLVGDDEVGDWRKLDAGFPGGPFLSQVGIPLACGRYLRFAACTANPLTFLKTEFVDMEDKVKTK